MGALRQQQGTVTPGATLAVGLRCTDFTAAQWSGREDFVHLAHC